MDESHPQGPSRRRPSIVSKRSPPSLWSADLPDQGPLPSRCLIPYQTTAATAYADEAPAAAHAAAWGISRIPSLFALWQSDYHTSICTELRQFYSSTENATSKPIDCAYLVTIYGHEAVAVADPQAMHHTGACGPLTPKSSWHCD
jgi:hypothetical protein